MAKEDPNWTFFSNYGHIYFLIALQNDITIRTISNMVGLTERAVAGILNDLVEGGYIEKIKVGRSNQYKAVSGKTLRHPLEDKVQLSLLVEIFKDHNQT